jgi:hypothetical protein
MTPDAVERHEVFGSGLIQQRILDDLELIAQVLDRRQHGVHESIQESMQHPVAPVERQPNDVIDDRLDEWLRNEPNGDKEVGP